MMMASDNTATNVVIDAVGMEAVNTQMRALGTRSAGVASPHDGYRRGASR